MRENFGMKVLHWLLVCCMVFRLCVYGQSADDQMFRAAVSVVSDTAKLAGLKRFIADVPQSKLVGDAYGAKFSVLMIASSGTAQLFLPRIIILWLRIAQSLPGALHNVAMELVFRKKYPDSALVLVDSAISLYKGKTGRLTPNFLTHKGNEPLSSEEIFGSRIDPAKAVALLPASIILIRDTAIIFRSLDMIQLETHRGVEGLEPYVHASFVSPQPSVNL